MKLLVIDQDREGAQQLGLACLDRGIAVAMAADLYAGIRVLLTEPVSAVIVDGVLLQAGAREHATLFERVAPGVPVIASLRSATPLEIRVGLELAGFTVVGRPVVIDEVVKAIANG